MSKLCSAVLTVALLAAPLALSAQVDRTRTWDVYGGFVVNRSPNAGDPMYNYGWDASLTQRMDSRRWVGGTVEGSAVYTKYTGSSSSNTFVPGSTFYMLTAGPVFTTRVHDIAPFGHALFGVVNTNASQVTVVGQPSTSASRNYFGTAVGGGLDFPISRGRHAAVRTQADWLRVWQNDSANADMLKLSAGLLYSFY